MENTDALLIWGYPLQCMRVDLLEVLLAEGASNLEVFDVIIHNSITSKDVLNYKAVYVVGRTSREDVPDGMPVICEMYSTELLISEKVKGILTEKFPSLLFNEVS